MSCLSADGAEIIRADFVTCFGTGRLVTTRGTERVTRRVSRPLGSPEKLKRYGRHSFPCPRCRTPIFGSLDAI